MKDYYKTLEISETATDDAVKHAYKKLAKKYHPDKNQGSKQAEERFKEVSEAYEVLSDPKKRKHYDAMRRFGHTPGFDRQGFAGSPEADFADFFKHSEFAGARRGFQGGTSFADILDEMFFARQTDAREEPSRDVHAELSVPFDTAVRGGEVTFAYDQGGAHTVRVRIPAGIDDGEQVRLRGVVGMGRNASADLILTIRIQPDEEFVRKRLDIYTDVAVNVAQVCFGSTARIRTVYGDRIDVKIPPGTQGGTVLKLNRLGVRSRSRTGDMYVTVRVEIPKHLTRRQKELMEELAKASDWTW